MRGVLDNGNGWILTWSETPAVVFHWVVYLTSVHYRVCVDSWWSCPTHLYAFSFFFWRRYRYNLASACISLELHICSVCARIDHDHDGDDDGDANDISVRSLRRQLHQVDPVFAFHSLRLLHLLPIFASLFVLLDFCENYAKCNFKLTCFMCARINLWHSQFNTHFSTNRHPPLPFPGALIQLSNALCVDTIKFLLN